MFYRCSTQCCAKYLSKGEGFDALVFPGIMSPMFHRGVFCGRVGFLGVERVWNSLSTKSTFEKIRYLSGTTM